MTQPTKSLGPWIDEFLLQEPEEIRAEVQRILAKEDASISESELQRLRNASKWLDEQLTRVRQQRDAAEVRAKEAERRVHDLESELASMRNSRTVESG